MCRHFFHTRRLDWNLNSLKDGRQKNNFLPVETKYFTMFFFFKCTARPMLLFFFFKCSDHSHRMSQRICTWITYLCYYHRHNWAIWIILLWWCTVKPIVLFTHRRRWCFHMGQVAYIHFHCIWWGSCGCLLWMFCSLIGDWFLLLVPIQSSPPEPPS